MSIVEIVISKMKILSVFTVSGEFFIIVQKYYILIRKLLQIGF